MKMPQNTADENIPGFFPLFFRAVDRLRLEGYVLALTQSGMSLSLVSNHEAILDHYSAILLARLRQSAPDVAVEVYFPASSEALLRRFNEILINSSIQDAMDGKVSLAAPRIWMVHDASALPDHEIQLLARLVQHFPAANIRVVLLMALANQKPNLLSSFGRRILCWDIEPPTAEQADNMLVEARVDGREVAARALLKKLSLPLAKPSASDPVAPATPSSTAPVFEDNHWKPEASLPHGGRWKLLLGGVALLIISTLLVAMYYASSQRMNGLNWNWQALLAGGNPMVNVSLPSVPVNAPMTVTDPLVSASAVATPQFASAASSPAVTASDPEKLDGRTEVVKEEVIEAAIERSVATSRPSEMLVGQGVVEKTPKASRNRSALFMKAQSSPTVVEIDTTQRKEKN